MSQRPRPYHRLSSHDDENEQAVSDAETMEVRKDSVDRVERTLDIRRERFDRIDQKASNILQFAVVLSGTIFAIFGLGPGETMLGRPERLPLGAEIALAAAGVGFLGTVLLAATTIITTRIQVGFSLGALQEVIDRRLEPELYYGLLLGAYRNALRQNRRRVRKNNLQFVATLYSVVLFVMGLSVAAGILVTQSTPRARAGILAVSTLLFVAFVVLTASTVFGNDV